MNYLIVFKIRQNTEKNDMENVKNYRTIQKIFLWNPKYWEWLKRKKMAGFRNFSLINKTLESGGLKTWTTNKIIQLGGKVKNTALFFLVTPPTPQYPCGRA